MSRHQLDRAAGGPGGCLAVATVPQLRACLGGGRPSHRVVQYYPRLTDDTADILEVTHTATQQGTLSPGKERVASPGPASPNPRELLPSEGGLTFCIPPPFPQKALLLRTLRFS